MTSRHPSTASAALRADLSPCRINRGPSRASLRDAVNQKCRTCIHDPKSGMGTWRAQVGACTVRACPLYGVRPLPRRGEGKQ